MDSQRCALCLFCEEITREAVRCTNADVAQDSGWDDLYTTQGYLDLPTAPQNQEPCFWFVQKH
jgi:hypothetical protein